MASGNENAIHRINVSGSIKVNSDLRFCIPFERGVGVGFHVGFDGVDDFIRKVKPERKSALGIRRCVAEHHTLVTCAEILRGKHGTVDLLTLLADKVDNLVNGIAELLRHAMYDFFVIDGSARSDFTAKHHSIIFDHCFNTAVAVFILL